MTAPQRQIVQLRDMVGLLDSVHRPTEAAFLAYGETLSRAVAILQKVGSDLGALAKRLSEQETRDTTEQLKNAVKQVVGLVGLRGRDSAVLTGIAGKTGIVATHVHTLRKTVGEVGLLAMNAKIQASNLTIGSGDFTVFTVEIARLGELAMATIGQTSTRLVQLRQVIQGAQAETGEFERRNSSGLSAVHGRLEQGLKTMAERRQSAARSAAQVSEKSAEVATRIASAIGEMQINDIAAQRIAHVSGALTTICELLEAETVAGKPDSLGLTQLDAGKRLLLAGTVLRLQSLQLSKTREEFCGGVRHLAAQMVALSHNAHDVLALASEAFGGTGVHGASFVGELEGDMSVARDLLQQMAVSRQAMHDLMGTLSADFSSMAGELRNIQSIDADMRVMGLNATLKCGRLGDQGRALGVIAQELRGCSKRTEEQARRLSSTLNEAMALAHSLATPADAAQDQLSAAAAGAMEASIQALGRLGQDLDAAFSHLHAGLGEAADLLNGTGQSIAVDRDVAAILDRAIGAIDILAGEIDPSRADPADVRHEVELLLKQHYTMDSERIVHELFADDNQAPCRPANPAIGKIESLDLEDCFL